MNASAWRGLLSAAILTASALGCGGGGSEQSASSSSAPPTSSADPASGGLPTTTPPPAAPAAPTDPWPGPTDPPPLITSQPADRTVILGTRTTFGVAAVGSDLRYQWRRNGVAIEGAESSTYSAQPADRIDNGAVFSVVVRGAGGITVSREARLTLVPSRNQQISESLMMLWNGGGYQFATRLSRDVAPAAGDYWMYSDGYLSSSPLYAGPQTVYRLPWKSMFDTFERVALPPRRVMLNGSILLVTADPPNQRMSYLDADVRVDTLASDGRTVALSELRTGYESAALTGAISASPAEFAHYFDELFSSRVIDSSVTYTQDSAYIKYTATTLGDVYNVYDCGPPTTGTSVSPCFEGKLEDALADGLPSTADGVVYRAGDGTWRKIGGVRAWIAAAPRPRAATMSLVPEYRMYFEADGSVFTGSLTPHGSPASSRPYVSDALASGTLERVSFVPYTIEMNVSARDTFATASRY